LAAFGFLRLSLFRGSRIIRRDFRWLDLLARTGLLLRTLDQSPRRLLGNGFQRRIFFPISAFEIG
jgi:hypothetical protein